MAPELRDKLVNTVDVRFRLLSTQQAADEIGISKRQLLRWLYEGKIPEVRKEKVGTLVIRLWSRAEIRRAQAFRMRSSKTRRKGAAREGQ